MKKVIFIPVILFVAGVLFLSALSPAAQVYASQKIIELKYATAMPPMASPYKAHQVWAKKIEEASGGQVKITFYPAQSLVKVRDTIPATQKGICNLGHLVLNREIRRYPLTTILGLPFMNIDPEKGVEIYLQLMAKFPEVKAEHKKFKVVANQTATGGHINTVKKTVRTPDDVKGLKITCSGHLARIMKSAGASPLSISPPEWYTALDRGLSEGHVMHYFGAYETKIYQLLPNHTEIGYGVNLDLQQIIMSWDVWNSLPPEVQKIFDDLAPWFSKIVAEYQNKSTNKGIAAMKEKGHTFIKVTPEEEQLWYKVALSLHEEWINKHEAEGLPARAVYEEALSLRDKLQQ